MTGSVQFRFQHGIRFLLVAFVALLSIPAAAQETDDGSGSSQSGSVDASPGFVIEPLEREISARPGATVDVQFSMKNLGSTRRLEAQPVALKQQRDGSITMADDSDPPEEFELTTSNEFDVSNREEATLEGEIQVTRGGGKVRYYGILVKDLGRPVEINQDDSEDDRTVVINYVTRYLLRVKLTVVGVSSGTVEQIDVVEQGLESREGFAYAYTVLKNNSGSLQNIQVRTKLVKKNGTPLGPPFRLHLPVNKTKPKPGRFDVEIFPNTEVVLRRKVPDPIFPGTYNMNLELMSGARVMKRHSREVKVNKNEFPAQEGVVSRIVREIYAEPVQVQLSRRARGNRIAPVELTNKSQQAVSVQLRTYPFQGKKKGVPWMTVRPDSFTIPAGQSRSVRVSANTQGVGDAHEYGYIVLEVQPEETAAGGKSKLPVSFLGPEELNVNPEFGELQFKVNQSFTGVVLPVENKGNVHLPLNAIMNIQTPFGKNVSVKGGFGRWLLPGETGEIRFRFSQVPPEGTYETEITVKPGHNQDSINLKRTFEIK